MERRAEGAIRRMADEHGQALDDPVVEYLAGLIAGFLEEGAPEGELEGLVETFNDFFDCIESTDKSVRDMIRDLLARESCRSEENIQETGLHSGFVGHGVPPLEPYSGIQDPSAPQTPVDDAQKCTMAGKAGARWSTDEGTVRDRPGTWHGREAGNEEADKNVQVKLKADPSGQTQDHTLNIHAEEFLPGSLDISEPIDPLGCGLVGADLPGADEGDISLLDLPLPLDPIIQGQGISMPPAKGVFSMEAGLKTLLFLFPEHCSLALEKLLTACDGNLRAAVRILGILTSEGDMESIAVGAERGCAFNMDVGKDAATIISDTDAVDDHPKAASTCGRTFQEQFAQSCTVCEKEPSADAGAESVQGDSTLWRFLESSHGEPSTEANLGMLSFLFPECSIAALEDVLAANHGNVQDAIRMVSKSTGVIHPYDLGTEINLPQRFPSVSVGEPDTGDLNVGSWDSAKLGSLQTVSVEAWNGAGAEHSPVPAASTFQGQDAMPGGCQSRSLEADVGLLSYLFPEYSGAALRKLLFANDGNVQDTARVLRMLKKEEESQSCASGTGPAQQYIPRIDLGEEAFPALPGAQAGHRQAQHWEQGKSNFAEIVKRTDKPMEGGLWQQGGGAGRRRAQQEKHTVAQSVPAVPWVATGEAVSQQYSRAREGAAHFARLRNRYFMEATKAYLSGNRAAAKHLGAEGRRHGARMKELHEGASEAIFRERNRDLSVSKGRRTPLVVDFHGLHVNEAVRILERELERMASEKPTDHLLTVNLIVGTGHHTKGSRTPSRLPAAIQQSLSLAGYSWRQSKPGLLEVKLK